MGAFGRRSVFTKRAGAICCGASVALVLGVVGQAGPASALPAAADNPLSQADPMRATLDGAPLANESAKPYRADMLVPSFAYFSSAHVAPTAVQPGQAAPPASFDTSNVVRIMKVTVDKPADANTRLEIKVSNTGLMQIAKQAGNVGLRPGANIDLTTALKSVCVDGSTKLEGGTGTYGFDAVSCTLDPAKFDAGSAQAAGTEQAKVVPPPSDGFGAGAPTGGKATAVDSQTTLPIGLIAKGAARASSERAKNLDAWLSEVSGGSIPDGSPGANVEQDLTVKDAVKVTSGSGSAKAADLKWKQCFLPKQEGLAFRAACSPDVSQTLDFGGAKIAPRTVAGAVPQDTTANQSYGALNPGDTWTGNFSLNNSGSMFGFAGPSPFTGPNPDPKSYGKSAKHAKYPPTQFNYTPYLLTDLGPNSVTGFSVRDEQHPSQSFGDCRDIPKDKAKSPLAATVPPEVAADAMTVCGITQNEALTVNPLLSFDSNTRAPGLSAWDTSNSRGQAATATFRSSYTVPLNVLEEVANDPRWTVEYRQVKSMKYTDDNGAPLPEPTVVTETVPEYVSKAAPQAWAWVPDNCNVIAGINYCGATARDDTKAGPTGLKMVKVAEAPAFERRICGNCWPTPKVYENDWTFPDANNAAARKSRGATNIMQGQHAYLAVQGINQAQTPGDYERLKISVDHIPAGVSVTGMKFIKLPSKKPEPNPEAGQQFQENLWNTAIPDIFNCQTSPSNDGTKDATTKTTCSFKPEKLPLLKGNGPGGTKQNMWETGKYAALFEIKAAENAPPTANGELDEVTTSFEYPNFKQGAAAMGIGPKERLAATFTVIPADKAAVSATIDVKDQDQVKKGAYPWKPYDGSEVAVNVGGSEALKLNFKNEGQRWVRPGEKVTVDVVAPPGVKVGDVATDYDLDGPGGDQSERSKERNYRDGDREELTSLGERWVCEGARTIDGGATTVIHGAERKWAVDARKCSLEISAKRTEGWKPGVTQATAGQLPALVVNLVAGQESPTSDVVLTAKTTATTSAGELVSTDSPSLSHTTAQMVVVDPTSDAPSVEPFWVVRPVAGGHTQARVDVANINRGAAKMMNVLVDFSDESGGYANSAQGTGWTCNPVEGGSGKRAYCTYTGDLAENRPPSNAAFNEKLAQFRKEHPAKVAEANKMVAEHEKQVAAAKAAASRTNSLYLLASVPADKAGKSLVVDARASVLNISPTVPLGSEGGALSRPIGRPMVADAQTAGADEVAAGYQLDGKGIDFASAGKISAPNPAGVTVRLDAAKSVGAFEGQPFNVTWRQVCVEGTDTAQIGCDGAKPAKPVKWLSSTAVLSPAFEAQPVTQAAALRFEASVSDTPEPAETMPATRVTAWEPKLNTVTKTISVTIDPPSTGSQDQAAPAGDVERNAGAADENAVVGKPTQPATPTPTDPVPSKSTPATEPKEESKSSAAAKKLAEAVKLCEKYLDGKTVDLKAGSITFADGMCSIAAGQIELEGWLKVTDAQIKFNASTFELTKGTFEVPSAWEPDAKLTGELKDDKPLIIPLKGGGNAQGTVTFSGGLPFSKQLNQLGDYKKKSFQIGFNKADGTASFELDAQGDGSPAPALNIAGSIARGGDYQLAINKADNPFKIPGVDSFTLVGDITRTTTEKNGKPVVAKTYKVEGTVDGVPIGSGMQLKGVRIFSDSSGALELAGTAMVAADSGSPLEVAIAGSKTAKGISLNGEVKDQAWTPLSDSKNVNALVALNIPSGGGKFTGSAKLSVPGEAALVGGRVTTGALTANVVVGDTDTSLEGGLTVTLINTKGEKLPMELQGAATYNASKKFDVSSLSVTQPGKDPFELVNGLTLAGVKVAVENPGDPATRAVKFEGGNVAVDGWLALDGVTITSNTDGLVVGQGAKATLPAVTFGSDITVQAASDLTFPAKGSPSGSLSSNAIPFVNGFPGLTGVAVSSDIQGTTRLTLGDGGTVSIDVNGKSEDQSREIVLAGGFKPSGDFTLSVEKATNVFSFPGAQSTTLSGDISWTKGTFDYAALGMNIKELNIGDLLFADDIAVTSTKVAGKPVLNLDASARLGSVDPAQAAAVQLTGSITADQTKVGVKTTQPISFPGMPGVKVSAKGDYTLDKATKKYTGEARLEQAEDIKFAGDKVALTGFGIGFDVQESGTKVGAGGTVQVVGVDEKKPLIMTAVGEGEGSGSQNISFTKLVAKQDGTDPFEIAPGFTVSGLQVTMERPGGQPAQETDLKSLNVSLAAAGATMGEWVSLSNLNFESNATGMVVKTGEAKLSAAQWGKDLTLKIHEPLTIPTSGPVTGAIQAQVLPFADTFETLPDSQGALANPNLTIRFGDQNTVEFRSGTAEKYLHLDGAVRDDGAYTLKVSSADFFKFFGDATGSVNGTIAYDKSKAKPLAYDVTGTIKDFAIGDTFSAGQIDLTATEAGAYSLSGTNVWIGPKDEGVQVGLGGSVVDNVTTLKVDAASKEWPLLGAGQKVTAAGAFTYTGAVQAAEGVEAKDAAYSGQVALSLDKPLDPADGLILVTAKGDEAKAPAITFDLAKDENGKKITLGASGQLVVADAADKAKKTTLTLDANYEKAQDKSTFALTAQTEGDAEVPIASGITVKNVQASLKYETATVNAQKTTQRSVSLQGNAGIALPSADGSEKRADVDIDTTYDDKGLAVWGKWNQPWNVASGLDLNDVEVAYRSPGNVGSSDKSERMTKIGNFQGMVVAATLNSAPGGFLNDKVGLTGDIDAVARVDSAAKTYEVSIEGANTWNAIGDPVAAPNDPAVYVEKPYLRVTRAPSAASEAPQTTVALGGTGYVNYAGAKSPAFVLGASVDVEKKTFSGSLKQDAASHWVGALGVNGLDLKGTSVDLGIKDGEVSASVFSSLQAASAPAFLKSMGLESDAPVSFGASIDKLQGKARACAEISIGDDAREEAALRPFAFMSDDKANPLRRLLNVSYANFVVASGECKIGTKTVQGSEMMIKGDVLGVMPVQLALKASQKGGGSIAMATDPAESTNVDQAPLGPATLEQAKVNIGLDTAAKSEQLANMPQAAVKAASRKGASAKTVAPSEAPVHDGGPSFSVQGMLPFSGKQVAVKGSVAKGSEATSLKLALSAGLGKDDSLDLGGLKIGGRTDATGPTLAAAIEIDPLKKAEMLKSLGVTLDGRADVSGTKIGTVVQAKYEGGSIQEVAGTLDAQDGVVVSNKGVLRGSGSISWTATEGLRAMLGDPATKSGLSIALCPAGVTAAKACDKGQEYSLSDAFVDFSDAGFNAEGTLKIAPGAGSSRLEARLSGAFFTAEPKNGEKITIGDGEQYDAKQGDFRFGVENATLDTPAGSIEGGIAVASYHNADSQPVYKGVLGFTAPILGGELKFKGDFDTAGLYDVNAQASGMDLLGYQVDVKAQAKNKYTEADAQVLPGQTVAELPAGKSVGQKRDTPRILIDASASFGNTFDSGKKIRVAGLYGADPATGSRGVRLLGTFDYEVVSGKKVGAKIEYSNFPTDSGFGFEFAFDDPSGASIGFTGVFRKDAQNDNLYRVAGKGSFPMGASKAQGKFVFDNCDDVDGSMCASRRAQGARITIAAAVPLYGGAVTVALEGTLTPSTGAFRITGNAKMAMKFGPYSFFSIIRAEAGFQVAVGVCAANNAAISESFGCGPSKNLNWAAGMVGSAWASVTADFYFYSASASLGGNVKGLIDQSGQAKACADFDAFGRKLDFGTCPSNEDMQALGL